MITLIRKAYQISTDFRVFHKELEFLKEYFKQYCYSVQIMQSTISKFLDNVCHDTINVATARKLTHYIKIPFYGPYS